MTATFSIIARHDIDCASLVSANVLCTVSMCGATVSVRAACGDCVHVWCYCISICVRRAEAI